MSTQQNITDRKRGALFGLAVGDALGAAVEFQQPGSFPPVTGFRSGGPHPIPVGAWTDDTSMALALAHSIAEVGWDIHDQVKRYLEWWKDGKYSVTGHCFDIGNTTASALSRFQKTNDATTSGSSDHRASGNGSIMRLAPVPIRYAELFPDQLAELANLAGQSSLPTHASPACISACRYLAIVLTALIQGTPREKVLNPNWEPLDQLRSIEPLHPEVDAIASGSFREREPPRIRGTGYVVSSLEAALWAFHSAPDFASAVLAAVNLGEDADTTGAVCGQLAGACWGETGIPAQWRNDLVHADWIAQSLDQLLSSQSPSPHN